MHDRQPRTMIDLFAGAGGLSQGLGQAQFQCRYANERVLPYAETYARNHPNTPIEQRDIQQVDETALTKRLNLQPGDLDLLCGGPPCQGFSINAPQRHASDERNHLFRDYLRMLEAFSPKAFLIENVPGLVSFEAGATLTAILDSTHRLGYISNVQILYAPHYGVPQTRWRTIIIGLRKDLICATKPFPPPRFSAPMRVNFTSQFQGQPIVANADSLDLPPVNSLADAISDLPQLKNGETGSFEKTYRSPPQNTYQAMMRSKSRTVMNHEAPRLGSANMERLSYIPLGGNWTDIPHELLPKGMQRARRSDHTKRYGRIHPSGLASTILTKCDPHWGAYFHYDQDRVFTVREAARLQSFPDHFVFTGSRSEQYEQVGNAVPPLMAQALGEAIAKALEPATQPRYEMV